MCKSPSLQESLTASRVPGQSSAQGPIVVLPPGEHEIVFSFAPASLRIGMGISLVGLLALMAVMTLDWIPLRRRHKAE